MNNNNDPLSTFTAPSELQSSVLPDETPPQGRRLVFDACNVGVVLRAVLFVESVVAVAAMFGTSTLTAWLFSASLLTGGAMPATLAWLIAACSMKKILARLTTGWQYAAGMALGSIAGLYGCAMLALGDLVDPAPWVSSASAGALLSAALITLFALRARGRVPAATAARLTELQSRIRPHFLFNTLNSAIALVRAEPARAEALLEDLSDLFRHALIDQGETVTLAQEIQLAQRYLAIEQVRFGDRLRVEWRLDASLNTAQLPPLLLQPLVENAVKHGVEPSSSGGKLLVITRRKGAFAVIEITNTVPHNHDPDSRATRGHGIALDNVRDRLRLLHDLQCTFEAGIRGNLYIVRIDIPIETT